MEEVKSTEFPKWIHAHESHDMNLVAKTHDIHRDRATGKLSVLVHDAEEEAALIAEAEKD
jgi:hypothetical protein